MADVTCSVAECDRPVKARGWCPMHWKRWRYTGTTEPRQRVVRPPCSVDGCDRITYAKGICAAHYARLRVRGTLEPFRASTVEGRFWAMVTKTDDCWLWAGTKDRHGYGVFRLTVAPKTRKNAFAHRLAYEWLVGPIPEGFELDHLCRVHACVNPAHLEPVTHAENMRRGLRGMTTHCPYGHEYTPENTHITPRGGRDCKACWARENQRRRKK